ncbi:GFA family protein [Sphingomicrobium aestuariivivum]|uniref:GFA family protein n=1 Tax=Sphingomicrobium aestuariivivum TaxID=1582356 RepID=UPI001FD65FFC|nr:GFA family protein [Sphingomicrobium aestuariivivum]MCJ8190288.1 GFA family protein [Sphingomicrobium aestuariivivum]
MPEPPLKALSCNCSMCRMTGYLHVFVPHGDFLLLRGSDALTTYRFGTGAAAHLFCRFCGVKSYYQPRSHPEAWSLNARCLDEEVALDVTDFDGANWEAAKSALDGKPEGG